MRGLHLSPTSGSAACWLSLIHIFQLVVEACQRDAKLGSGLFLALQVGAVARQQAENLLFFKGAGALGQRERLGGGGCPEVFGEGQLGNETGRGQIGAERCV